jgi:putative ABC transport system permease protein
MNFLLQDLRYGLRLLCKSPSFTLVAVISLALGIGATTVIFSAVNGVLLRPLGFREPQRLIAIWGSFRSVGLDKNWISEPEFRDFQRDLHSYSDIAAYTTSGGLNLSGGTGEPLRVSAGAATSNFFSLLGIVPPMGRAFAAGEDQLGHDNVVLLSHSLWKNRFASERKIVGQSITLDSRTYTIIGVLPDGFHFGGASEDVWVPIGFDPAKPGNRGSHELCVIARLAPGVGVEQASSELSEEARNLFRIYPNNYSPAGNFGLQAFSLKADLVQDARTPLLVLLAAVGCLLLIAAANVANLLLARAAQREKEIAVRAALGASRVRIIRQLTTEGVALSLIGCGLGTAFAYWGVDLLIHLSGSVPRAEEIRLDSRVLLFSVAVSLVTGVLFGLAPALHLVRTSTSGALKEGGRSNTAGRVHQRMRNGLAAAEVGLALVLLVGAGLLIRSFYRLLDVDPGFKAAHLLSFRLTLPTEKYRPEKYAAFFRRVLDNIGQMPGVESAGAISELPLSGAYSSESVVGENAFVPNLAHTNDRALPYTEVDRRIVTPGYFETLGVRLRAGRTFTAADDENAPKVVIVDKDFGEQFWPGQDPLGRRIAVDNIPNTNPPEPRWRTIVGVVDHVRHYALDQRGREQIYFPLPQYTSNDEFIAVRTSADPDTLIATIRKSVYQVDSEQPIYQVKTMDELLDDSFSPRRFNLVLLGLFAGLALVMAAIGIYGVISYSVTQRTQEFGIRMALGAQQDDVVRLVLSQAGLVLAIGCVGGLAGSVLLSRALASLLFGINAVDPVTFAGVALLVCVVAVGASYMPARRATKVDPMVALHYE